MNTSTPSLHDSDSDKNDLNLFPAAIPSFSPAPSTSPSSSSPSGGTAPGLKKAASRRSYSCGPCKQHKTKCDHSVPCSSCQRYRREALCLKSPATPSVPKPPRGERKYRQLEIVKPMPAQQLVIHPAPLVNNNASDSSRTAPVLLARTPNKVVKESPTKPIRWPSNGAPQSLIPLPSQNGISQRQPQKPTITPSLPTQPAPAVTEKDHKIKLLSSRINDLENIIKTNLICEPDAGLYGASITPGRLVNTFSSNKGLIHDIWNLTSSEDNCRLVLLRLLPTKEHCKIYVDYYFEHVDYIYHPLHNMTFLREFDEFWAQSVDKVDMPWLAILFMVISLSALHLPKTLAKELNIEDSMNHASAIWFKASRKALDAAQYEEKPTFRQLQVFSLMQLYLYATNQIELLNSLLSQAVRHAQYLGLHADVQGKNPLETELRRRIWWDICGCDTFQSLCLGRPTLVRSYYSTVPFPKNCHEEDMSEAGVVESPLHVPTIMSFQIERHRVMKILNRLCPNTNNDTPSYQEVLFTDREFCEYAQNLPWFFQSIVDEARYSALLSKMPYIGFQHHVLHTCNCMHRVRIHQPFLHPRIPTSWAACYSSVKPMFLVYRRLRGFFGGVSGSYSFIPQIHQSFSAAVAQGLFLLVEKPTGSDFGDIYNDVEMFIKDLNLLFQTFFVDIPILTSGMNAIRQIREAVSADGFKQRREPSSTIVSGVYSVFGGRKNTEKYLSRCAIDFLVNDDRQEPQHDAQYNSQQLVQITAGPINPQPSFVVPAVPPPPVDGHYIINDRNDSTNDTNDLGAILARDNNDNDNDKVLYDKPSASLQPPYPIFDSSARLAQDLASPAVLQHLSPGMNGGESAGRQPSDHATIWTFPEEAAIEESLKLVARQTVATPQRPKIDFLRWDDINEIVEKAQSL